MGSFFKSKLAVSNGIFGAAVAILVIVAAVGFGLYGTSSSKTVTSLNTIIVTATSVSTQVMTESSMMANHSETAMMGNSSGNAYMLSAKSGAMISSGWLLAAPTGMMHEYAVSIHATGLEPNGTYLLEGALMVGAMATVPISSQAMGMNTTSASEFQADKNGTGNYWIVLNNNPATTFERVQLFFLPGMSMQNATLIATASFTSMMNTTETMMTTS